MAVQEDGPVLRFVERSKRSLFEFSGKKTGLIIDAYFSGTRSSGYWIAVEGRQEKGAAGELSFEQCQNWLI